MDPITLLLGGALFLFMRSKKKNGGGGGSGGKGGGSEAGTDETKKTDQPGQPSLKIADIRPVFNSVHFVAKADGKRVAATHKAKDPGETKLTVGNYYVVAVTDPGIRQGQKKPDVVMILMKRSDGKTIIAKRILIEDNKIIDIV